MNKTLYYEYAVVVNVNNISICLLACPYMMPDLNLLKATER